MTARTRQRTVAVLLVSCLLFPIVAPAAAAAGGAVADTALADNLSGNALATGGWIRYTGPPNTAVVHESGYPGWYVAVETDSDIDALRDWVRASDKRRLLAVNDDSNRVLITAPASHIGTTTLDRVLGQGLHAKGYVEYIAMEIMLSIPRDPEQITREEYTPPTRGLFAKGSYQDQSGVAYPNNTEQSTLKEARQVVDATGDRPTGKGVTVAVLDTGINTANGRVFGNGTSGSKLRITATKNTITNETGLDAVADGNGHGTWVASAIASSHDNASYEGVAPNASLAIAKVLGDDGSGSIQNIIQGIEWASEQTNATVISMSLGASQYSPVLAAEIREALAETQVTAVVVAAGNSRQTIRYLSTPADVRGDTAQADGIITVAATNVSAPKHAGSAWFSSVGPDGGVRDGSMGATRGALPTIAAPGTAITAKVPGTDGLIANKTLSGTSMATPIVSGLVALMLSQDSLTNESATVEQRLAFGADPIPHAGYTEVGAGMASLTAALTAASDTGSYYADQKAARTAAAKARDAANKGGAGILAGIL